MYIYRCIDVIVYLYIYIYNYICVIIYVYIYIFMYSFRVRAMNQQRKDLFPIIQKTSKGMVKPIPLNYDNPTTGSNK